MYCEKCGKEIRDDALFCGHCGQRIDDGSLVKPISGLRTTTKESERGFKPIEIIIMSVVALIVIGLIVFFVYEATRYNHQQEMRDSYNSNSYSSNSHNSSSSSNKSTSFAIEGKWKSVGNMGFGQAQPGSIVNFNGTNCNFFSPSDTYAFYKSGSSYILDVTSMLTSQNLSCKVNIIDNNNIEITYGSTVTKLKRMS